MCELEQDSSVQTCDITLNWIKWRVIDTLHS